MTVKHLYPDVEPSLNLDFANTKRLDPRITFSRSSTATYVGSDGLIKTAPINGARFDHDPETGDSLGLLIEEARTNNQTHSNNFTTNWTLGGAGTGAVYPNSALAPDGTVTASKLACESTKFLSSPANGYAGGNTGVTYNVSTGAFVSIFVGGPTSHGATAVGNGWYRVYMTVSGVTCSVYAKAVELSQITIQLYAGSFFIYSSDGSAGNTTDGILIWGAQLEAGSFPTSYIPTAGATVTRAADVAQITGANFSSWYNQSEGTLLTSIAASTVSNSCAWTISDGSVNNRITSFTHNSPYSFYVVTGGSIQVQQAAGGYTKGVRISAAGAYATNNFNYARSGTALTADTLGTVPVVNQLRIMAGVTGGNIETGTISRLTYYPVRLPDATLQALTF